MPESSTATAKPLPTLSAETLTFSSPGTAVGETRAPWVLAWASAPQQETPVPPEEQTKEPLPARRVVGLLAAGAAAAEDDGAAASLPGHSQCPPRAPPTNPRASTLTATTGRTQPRRGALLGYWETSLCAASISVTAGNG